MLINFGIANYLSFNDEVKVSMEAASIRENQSSNTFLNDTYEIDLLKGGVLYGANAAGKSNFIKAVKFVRKFILSSSKDLQANEKIDIEIFKLSTLTSKKPSRFFIEFIVQSKRYKYSFSVDQHIIYEESLYEVLKTKDRCLFSRTSGDFELHEDFTSLSDLILKTRTNALFLSVAAQFNNSIATSIIKWFQDLQFFDDINFQNQIQQTARLAEDPKKKVLLLKILKLANLGFEDLQIHKLSIDENILSSMPKELRNYLVHEKPLRVSTVHKKYDHLGNYVGDILFDLSKDESLGTQKYFALASNIIKSLENGATLFIDELDARLHPSLSSLIVWFFNSPNNPYNAQLIFSTHNTNLMSVKLLRRDQVFIFSKSKMGATEIKTLHELKVRNDASFEKEYLSGEYNGVPFKELPTDFDLF